MLVHRDAGTHLGVVANKPAREKVSELAYKRDKDLFLLLRKCPHFSKFPWTLPA
jgi:hypothetical protein